MRLKLIHIYSLMIVVFIYVVAIVYVVQKYGGKTVKSDWKTPRKILILVSQPRSGSTYLGQVISQTINSMYLYEPLYRLDSHFGIDANFANKTMRKKYESFAKTSLRNIFRCNFEERKELRRLYNSPFKELSKFSDCDPKKRETPLLKETQNRKNHVVKFCLPYVNSYSLQEDCHNNNLMVKFLEMRIPQANINHLADLIPYNVDYKIIYLVRDPRAAFWSLHRQRWIAGSFADDRFQNYIPRRCQEMERSLDRIKSNPNFILIRYEDLITRVDIIMGKLKDFLGKEDSKKMYETLEENSCYVPPNTLLNNLKDITEENGDDIQETEHDNILVDHETLKDRHRRKYQCATINKWRMTATMPFVNSVEAKCSNVMKRLGYKLINDNYRRLKQVRRSLIESEFAIT